MIEPESGRTKPAIVFSSVVLPAPLRPTQATISLCATLRSTSKSTFDAPYAALTPRTFRTSRPEDTALSDTTVAFGRGIDLPVASANLWMVEAFLVTAFSDHAAFVHHDEPLEKILDV